MTIGQLPLAVTAAFALAGMPIAAPMVPLGVVTEANEANLSTGSVSAGTTLYDGDRLSTEAQGRLRVRCGPAMIYLRGASEVTLRGMPSGEKGAEADLNGGTLVFSTLQTAAIEIHADDALIRPAADAPTVGQITVAGPKKLYVYARRGALLFSYQDESEVIAEGQSYRVVLDPPDDDPAAKSDEDRPAPKPSRRRRGFLFFLLAPLAIATWLGAGSQPIESPDHP